MNTPAGTTIPSVPRTMGLTAVTLAISSHAT